MSLVGYHAGGAPRLSITPAPTGALLPRDLFGPALLVPGGLSFLLDLDGDRLEHNNALRTPMNHGIRVAISSDILPIGPMVGIYAAVTRKGMSGRVFGAEEALSVMEALRAYTLYGAWLSFDPIDVNEVGTARLKVVEDNRIDFSYNVDTPDSIRGTGEYNLIRLF